MCLIPITNKLTMEGTRVKLKYILVASVAILRLSLFGCVPDEKESGDEGSVSRFEETTLSSNTANTTSTTSTTSTSSISSTTNTTSTSATTKGGGVQDRGTLPSIPFDEFI